MLSVQKDLNNICRICLQEVKVNDATNLFSEVIESKNIFKMIELCFQIILDCKRFLPSVICSYCMNEFNIANSFRMKCITSEEKILSHYRQLSEHNKKEIENEVEILISNHESAADFKNFSIIDSNTNKVVNEVKENLEDKVENKFSAGNHSEDSDDENKITDTFEFTNQDAPVKIQAARKKTFIKCCYCERNFETRKLLLEHKVSMHERHQHNVGIKTGFGATRRYHCKVCSYSSPYSQTLMNHVRRHTGEKPYICGECGKRFPDFSCLYSHRRTHSNTTYFVCSKCGKQFKTGSGLRQHSRFHEGGKYCCEICKKVYKSKHTLRDHILQHNNIRNFSCEDCGRTFVTSSGLIHHKEVHKKNERNFECALCGFKTQKKRKFNAHLRSHSADRPHKCKLCDKTFYTRQGVQSHQRVHAAEKEFKCPLCPKAYTRRRSLLRHLKGKHGTEYHSNDQKIAKNCIKTKDIVNDELNKKN